MAAVRWSVVFVLTFLVVYALNTSSAHISDYNTYTIYDGNLEELERRQLQPLLRFRRSDLGTGNENSKTEDMKSADPIKNKKVDNFPDKSDKKKLAVLKKDASSTKASESSTTVAPVMTPSANVFVSTSTPKTAPAATTTTTVTTAATTTITSTTTTVTSSPMPSNESRVNLEDNRTGGLTVTQNVTEENKGEPVAPAATTANGTSSDSPTENDTVTPVQVSVEDPDSWDDKFPNISDEFSTQNTTVDHHRYYNSVTYSGMQEAQQYWVDLDSLKGESVVTNEMLSASHRRAVTVTLTFEFPFYGHMLKNITIATGGFLFTGDFVHTWLAATQYIAPLMANFDTSISKDAVVKYADNGTSFTVQWNNVLLKDHADAGTFTFQATLHKNGDIVFAYKQVPVIITKIGDEQHPVKVGLSDAYIVDRTIFFVRRKTIYEYHKIDKKTSGIGNWTAILFKALPTCVSLNSCTKCLSQKISFQCQWCSEIGRCSNGLDRHRQDWLHNGCEALHVQTVSECTETDVSPTTVDTFGHDASVESYSKDVEEAGSAVGTVVGVVFLVALIFGITGWVMYAYFFPHSPSGQILIRYRPSTWSWKRGEARYTAASIHSIHM
ncbi:plexin domain-containing protein 2 isoform X2 [Procambarus clarkii]|uniref:plexin domain-containing protein 2 isoform X2 n=1 Tax=Procambarus clarkii TaxID=6728 RepID=UPI0037428371